MVLKKRILAALALCFMFNVSVANALWVYKKIPAADASEEFHMLKMAHDFKELSFFCANEGVFVSESLFMITYDVTLVGVDAPTARGIYASDFKLLITIDDNETVSMPAFTPAFPEQSTELEEVFTLSLVSATRSDLMQQTLDAKSGIEVELEVEREGRIAKLLKETFPVYGLSEAGRQFKEGCESLE